MSAENFFASTNKERENQTKDWINHMKTPREKIEGIDLELPKKEPVQDIPKQEDSENVYHLDYTPEQLWSAELALHKFDETLAWGLSIWTGKDANKYRRRKEAATKDDREVQLLAAIINKYQMKMSIEMAFITLFIMGYSPIFIGAYADAKAKTKAKAPKQEPIRTNSKTNPSGPIK